MQVLATLIGYMINQITIGIIANYDVLKTVFN